MFAYVPSPNADPVIVVGIVLVALVVLGFVLWSSFAEEAAASEKGWRPVRRRKKQKTAIMAASKPKSGVDLGVRAKFKSSTILGSVDYPPTPISSLQKPKSDFNLWMHLGEENTPHEVPKEAPKEKALEVKKQDMVA